MEQVNCVQCGYVWFPRVDHVKMCPRCKSYWWNAEKEVKCKQCEFVWFPQVEYIKVCPNCKSHMWNMELPAKCSVCERTFDKLNVHHIDGNHENNDKDNMIILCDDCHSVIHNGLRENNRTNLNNGKAKRSRTRKYRNEECYSKKLLALRTLWLDSKNKKDVVIEQKVM